MAMSQLKYLRKQMYHLNTCSIREKAQEKVFHQLGRWKTLKDVRRVVIRCALCSNSRRRS
ncbi:hypothetical protein O9993_01740 [Vibrio lentus]|nr:hypothetical protein [Vibrio lentus]